jgi:DNA-binding CsgD family transcriptional regulator
MEQLCAELSRTDRFEVAAELVCVAVRERGVASCTVVLRRSGEMPAVSRHGVAANGRLSLPVTGPRGWLATLVCFGAPAALERELALIANVFSVWCAARGIDVTRGNDSLTPRQHEIAQLAALGQTYAEIASSLGISVNTVKARLKEVFARLGVSNRIELADALRQPLRVGKRARGEQRSR